MVKGSQSWITESQSWLTAPYTYTTAKCLDSHANALQMVLDDSAQIRRTLQGFESVLQEMASVCDVSRLQQELHEADQRVTDLQSSILEPLKTLVHAAAEVDSMETELRIMEKDVIELKLALTSKQGISQDKFMAAENRIKLMKRTVDELKSCKAGLCLPEGAENTLAVFRSADLLMKKLLELEQLALEHTVVVSEPCETSSTLRVPPTIAEEEPQDNVLEQGQVEIVHLTEDILTRSGAVLMTVQEITLEQKLGSSSHTQPGHNEAEQKEEEIFVDVREDTDNDSCYEDAREENEVTGGFLGPESCETVKSFNTEDIESGGKSAPADSTESHTKEPDRQAAEGEHVGSEPPTGAEAAAEPKLGRGAWEVMQIESKRLKTHTSSSTTSMFRELTHTRIETTDAQGTVTPRQVMNYSAEEEEEELRREEIPSLVSGFKDTGSVIDSDQVPHTLVHTLRPKRTADSLFADESCHLSETPPSDESLRSCHEKAAEMELWLEKAQLSLQSDGQQSVEEHLHTCQAMFMEIEQKVAGVSAPAGDDDEEQKTLSAKLQLLKNKLVCVETERPLQPRLKRSASVQEMLSTRQAKLFRQSSLQQQKISSSPVCVLSSADGAACLQELQSHVTHLRELGHTAKSAPDVQVVDEGLFEVLSGITLCLSLLSHTHVSQPGAAYTDTHTQMLQLQSLSAELSSLSAQLTSQGSEVIGSLGSVAPAAGVCVDLLQDRVSELQKVLSEKQEQMQKQLEHTLQKQSRIKHMHAALLANTSTLKTLTNDTSCCDPHAQLQAVVGLHEELQQQERELEELREETERQEEVIGLARDITTLESVLDSVYEVQCSVEQQQQCENILKGLQELLELGKQRLAHTAQLEPHTPEQLPTLLSAHTKFFLSLDSHLQTLQYLTAQMPDNIRDKWNTAAVEVENRVDELQREALRTGTALQVTVQVWTQWEKGQSWLEKLIYNLKQQLPRLHLEEQPEEALQRNLSIYEKLQAALGANEAQIGSVYDQTTRLRNLEIFGISMTGLMFSVGLSGLKLKQRLAALQRKIEQGRVSVQHLKKLWKRYRHDSTALADWMNEARERLNSWKGHMTSAGQAISNFTEFIELCKELEVKSSLKSSVISSGSEILQLNESELIDIHPQFSRSTHHSQGFEGNSTHGDISSVKDDSGAENIKGDSTNNESLESTRCQDLCYRGEDTNVQNESPVSPDKNASMKMSGNVMTDVVQVMELPPVLFSLKNHLTEVEHGWVELHADISAVQQKLQQVCEWLGGAESCLHDAEKNDPGSNTATQLTSRLNTYKELKRAQMCVQMSVDFLNRMYLKEVEPTLRYKHTAFAEQLGDLNMRWTTLQTHLYAQTQYAEQQLSICVERDGKLRLLLAWIRNHETLMRLAERPVCYSAAEEQLNECEILKEELKVKSAQLEELKKSLSLSDGADEGGISHINTITQALTALTEQNCSLKQTLQHLCEQWSGFERGRCHVAQSTQRICQSLRRCHTPHISFTALQKSISKLQSLHTESEEVDKKWAELDHTFSSLTGCIHSGTSDLLSEELQKERLRWTEVKQDVTHTSLRLHTLLQAWKQYSDLSSSCLEKLRQQKEQFCDVLKMASESDSDTETLATCMQRLQVLLQNVQSLQTDTDQTLEASKESIRQMEPPAAASVRSGVPFADTAAVCVDSSRS
ncbi:Nesprin-2 [Bagarius yarrelli]|uniref:Nesprin-2 n=1 Tax=Bagarius yarrelli TaxID=175774 RepID=A0A556V4Z4_BAGYA|nr:Nesprin-2 [Bagarius yarrelli]